MRRRMNKRAVAILILSSLAFIAAIFVFSAITQKVKPGPKVDYIGEQQLELFDFYGCGEEMSFYLDTATKYSAETITIKDGMTDWEYLALFKEAFAKHLVNFNKVFYTRPHLFVDNYTFSVKEDKLLLAAKEKFPVYCVGVAVPKNIFSQIDYKINPSVSYKNENIKKLKPGVKPSPSIINLAEVAQPKVDAPSTISLRSSSEYFPFVVVSDMHVGDQNKEWHKSGVNQILSLNPGLVVVNGDMIDGNPSDSVSKIGRMWSYFDLSFKNKIISAGIILIPSAGNHDPFLGKYVTFWESYKPNVENLNGNYPKYYSFDYKGSHFVIIYAPVYTIDSQQMSWLISDLNSARGKYNNIFVFGHMPLQQICSQISHCPITLKPKDDLLKLFKDNGVTFYSNGHHHAYNKGSINGVDILSSGSMYVSYLSLGKTSSGGTYRQQPSFMFVDVKGSKVSVKSYTGTGFSSVFDEAKLHQVPGYDPLISVS